MNVSIKKAENTIEYAQCAAIRALVYVEEQNCSLETEYDQHEDECEHFLLMLEREPVATARYRIVDGKTGKIERIAVLKKHRKQGFGRRIVEHLTALLKDKVNLKKIIMHAQEYALPFYKKLGYLPQGESYMQANIPHRTVCMMLPEKS